MTNCFCDAGYAVGASLQLGKHQAALLWRMQGVSSAQAKTIDARRELVGKT